MQSEHDNQVEPGHEANDYRHSSLVPRSTTEMLPPRPKSITIESANWQRNRWPDLVGNWEVIAGEAESENGSAWLDKAELTFKVRGMIEADGATLLAKLNNRDLWTALRRGYRYNSGISVRRLERQRTELRLAHLKGLRHAAE